LATLIHTVSSVEHDVAWPASALIDSLLAQRGPVLIARKFSERVIECGQSMTAIGFVKPFNGDLYLVPSPDSAISVRMPSELCGSADVSHIELGDHLSGSLLAAPHATRTQPIILSAKSFEQILAEEIDRVARLRRISIIGASIAALSLTYIAIRSAYRTYCRWVELQRMLMFSELRREERERRLTRNRKRGSHSLVRRRHRNDDSSDCDDTKVDDDSNVVVSGDVDDTASTDRICVICLSAESNALLLDCGHAMTCLDCASRLQVCPICRSRISRFMRFYA